MKLDKRYPRFAIRLTAGKRQIKDFPKLPSATSFIHKSCLIPPPSLKEKLLTMIIVVIIWPKNLIF